MRTAFTKLTLIVFAFAIVGLSRKTALPDRHRFVIVNINAPDVGFNDPNAGAPVGGNPGTTLGQQRLISFRTCGRHLVCAARQQRADSHSRTVRPAWSGRAR